MNFNTVYKTAMFKRAGLRGNPAFDRDPVEENLKKEEPDLNWVDGVLTTEDDRKNNGSFAEQDKTLKKQDYIKGTGVTVGDFSGNGGNLGTTQEQQANQVAAELNSAKQAPAPFGYGELFRHIMKNPGEYMRGYNQTDALAGGGSALLTSILTGGMRSPGLRLLYTLLAGLGGAGLSRIGRDVYNAYKAPSTNNNGYVSLADRIRTQIQNGARS